ncbi:TetR/AcrR family transcriptional regulator [Rhodosalinus sp.]|uniref:TetR/AcrR family transcriptional regulator n=1 Tax=Rhodosalinus sp. TaxID=2047741 RepID=UPI00397D90CB
MVQKKKPEIRDGILEAAGALFRERGYANATMSAIARRANTSPANIYVYFGSKLDILLAVYEPWLRDRIEGLEARAEGVTDPEARIRLVLRTLWREIPADDNHFARNLSQALSTGAREARDAATLRRWCEARVGEILSDALPDGRRDIVCTEALGHLVISIFDGVTLSCDGGASGERLEAVAELFAVLLLGQGSAVERAAGDPRP